MGQALWSGLGGVVAFKDAPLMSAALFSRRTELWIVVPQSRSGRAVAIAASLRAGAACIALSIAAAAAEVLTHS